LTGGTWEDSDPELMVGCPQSGCRMQWTGKKTDSGAHSSVCPFNGVGEKAQRDRQEAICDVRSHSSKWQPGRGGERRRDQELRCQGEMHELLLLSIDQVTLVKLDLSRKGLIHVPQVVYRMINLTELRLDKTN